MIPVLKPLLRDNARWTATIRTECARQQRRLDLPGLVDAAEELLGDPLRPEDGEQLAIRQLRGQMASPGDHAEQHLGEAETITLIQRRMLRAVFLTDDRTAMRWADPIDCVGTWKLIRLARRRDLVTPSQAARLWESFVSAGGTPPREIATRDAFVRSLE
ncbi:hypothetical protein [Brachybacterium phenoliresistens]|uniref:hypothetical protein n=1 Tax=Brachybacterium phenoliresistens TaxID=396014 RepID=UPI000686C7E8|nr:hypothetical protein [Brachybacterium phenoliresistens]